MRIRQLFLAIYFLLICTLMLSAGLQLHEIWRLWNDDAPRQAELRALRTRNSLRLVSLEPHLATATLETTDTLDYHLATAFAAWLQVNIEIVIATDTDDLWQKLENGEADIAINIPQRLVDPSRFHASTPYTRQALWLVYDRERSVPPIQATNEQRLLLRRNDWWPVMVADHPMPWLTNGVPPPSEEPTSCRNCMPCTPPATVPMPCEIADATTLNSLLHRITTTTHGYTLLNQHDYVIYRHLFPDLEGQIVDELLLTAVFPLHYRGLIDAWQRFFSVQQRGRLRAWEMDAAYYLQGHNRFDALKLQQRIAQRLPRYLPWFRVYAQQYALDWKLLVALSYQESQWRANARSPTDVKGLMMLTLDTARMMEVKNRLNAEQSIAGGARYLRWLLNRFADIPLPQRQWFALAAYNLGLGHVQDGQRLIATFGGDPENWMEVRAVLPLLALPSWASKTRHGMARGEEAVTYVRNIRRFYAILSRMQWDDENL